MAVSIDLRTSVYIRPNKQDRVRIELKNINQVRSWPVNELNGFKLVLNPNDVLVYEEQIILDKLKPLMQSCYISSSSSADYCHSNKQTDTTGTNDSDNNNNNYLDCTSDKIVTAASDKCGHDAIVAFLMLYIGISDSYCSSYRPAIDVIVESQLPVGCGLGSSSALSVALCGALMKLAKVDQMADTTASFKQTVSQWAFAIDKYFHGTPSGIDNNIIAHGGCILFRQGYISQHKQTPIALTSILVDTCVTRSTKTLCRRVADKLADPEFNSQELFNKMDNITQLAWNELISHQQQDISMASMSRLLSDNQHLLDTLGVGHPALADIIDCCSKYGYCAKMTGAGGGGMAFVLVGNPADENLINLKRMLTRRGYRYYETHIGGEGLQVSVGV